jgi:Uma2 family endonuclease
METQIVKKENIIYPDSDGQPMADNTKQFNWIVLIKEGLEALFANRPDVFVAGDLLWYPVEGKPTIRKAPDVLVAFGRPKGDRGSYKQWEEDNIAPQVVFEINSPSNTTLEMLRKFDFYQRYGVQEYVFYDPDTNELAIWVRNNGKLETVEEVNNWRSPLLGVRFVLDEDTLFLYRPDGERFATYTEILDFLNEAKTKLEETKTKLEETKTELVETKTELVETKQQLEEEKRKREALAQKLRELGIDENSL